MSKRKFEFIRDGKVKTEELQQDSPLLPSSYPITCSVCGNVAKDRSELCRHLNPGLFNDKPKQKQFPAEMKDRDNKVLRKWFAT